MTLAINNKQAECREGQQVVRSIAASVAKTHGFTINDLLNNCRRRPLPDLRKVVAFEAMELGFPCCEIARGLQMNHASIIYMVKEYNKLIGFDPTFTDLVDQVDRFKEIKTEAND